MGKKYGDWRIIEPLKEGGQAYAYRVMGLNGKEAVLKVIKNPNRSLRYMRELEAYRRLRSPTIPRLIDSGEMNGKLWLVVENCGNSLVDEIEGATTITLLKWFKDVVKALCDAHAENIVHRDVKPNNVVVGSINNTASLVDFGICTLIDLDDACTSVEAFGNAAFAAPECFLGEADNPGPPCDVYSAGKLLYWMLSNRCNINREQVENAYQNINVPTQPLRSRIFSIIAACVKETPSQRITADELHDRMLRVVEYAQEVLTEYQQRIYRLVDNIGNDGHFNPGSSMPITSGSFVKTNVLDQIVSVSGDGPAENIALALLYENNLKKALHIRKAWVGMRCSTAKANVRLSVRQNLGGWPSDETLGDVVISLVHGPAALYTVDLNAHLSENLYWLVFQLPGDQNSCANLCGATFDMKPQCSRCAISSDGGKTWQFRDSPNGPGYAVRLEAIES